MRTVLILEAFYGGSHKQLVDLLVSELGHNVELCTLPAKKWHWRARTAALYFSQKVPQSGEYSSVLNLAEFIALRPELASLKKVLYFHENQLVYPVRKEQERDFQYGYNQVLSSLVADHVLFNSCFNMESFLTNIQSFMKLIPDHRPTGLAEQIRPKCRVLYYPLVVPVVTPGYQMDPAKIMLSHGNEDLACAVRMESLASSDVQTLKCSSFGLGPFSQRASVKPVCTHQVMPATCASKAGKGSLDSGDNRQAAPFDGSSSGINSSKANLKLQEKGHDLDVIGADLKDQSDLDTDRGHDLVIIDTDRSHDVNIIGAYLKDPSDLDTDTSQDENMIGADCISPNKVDADKCRDLNTIISANCKDHSDDLNIGRGHDLGLIGEDSKAQEWGDKGVNTGKRARTDVLHIVWPHRWEHDKNPELFFKTLLQLKTEGLAFKVSVLGETFSDVPDIFTQAREQLTEEIVHWGFVPSKSDYYNVLRDADVAVSTANHEFFGVAMLEAVHLGCFPLCPKKLVYPEIFPHGECLYNTENQLVKKLRTFCKKPHLARTDTVQLNLERFSWETLKLEFTEVLSV